MSSILFEKQNKIVSTERFPDRKGVYLCISAEGKMNVYARFPNEYVANKFIDELASLVGAYPNGAENE